MIYHQIKIEFSKKRIFASAGITTTSKRWYGPARSRSRSSWKEVPLGTFSTNSQGRIAISSSKEAVGAGGTSFFSEARISNLTNTKQKKEMQARKSPLALCNNCQSVIWSNNAKCWPNVCQMSSNVGQCLAKCVAKCLTNVVNLTSLQICQMWLSNMIKYM